MSRMIEPEEFLRQVAQFCAVGVPDATVLLSPDIESLALLLALLRKAKSEMDDACQWVEDELTKLMPGRYFSVEGLGQIEMHTGSKRTKWDKEGLIDVLVHAIGRTMPNLFNADTGEEVNLLDHVRMLVTMFTDAATPSWKVTGLRSYGIDPGDYCETSYGRKTIQLPALPKSTDTLYPSSE